MSLWMLGGGGWQAPFNRTFFNVSLGEMLKRFGKEKGTLLALHLIDGSQLDVRAIEELSDQYVALLASGRDETDVENRLHVIPYSAIYRIELARAPEVDGRRLGFRWVPATPKPRTAHNGQPRRDGRVNELASVIHETTPPVPPDPR